MEKSVFEFSDYRAYLLSWIQTQPKGGRGIKARLAEAMGSPGSHVSQVLSGISHLSLEQAAAVNEYLGHSAEEGRCFLLLVEHARAGTPALRRQLDAQIHELREKHSRLKEKLSLPNQPSEQTAARYYSEWTYSAVHMLLTIPGFRTSEKISARLGLSKDKVSTVLDFLAQNGMARAQPRGEFEATNLHLHLGEDSPWISRHHSNWRLHAIQRLQDWNPREELHYSAALTLSREDFEKIREILVSALNQSLDVVRPSKEEELVCLNLDWFRI